MGRKFKWVKRANVYGIRNWTEYDLFIEGRDTRVALIRKLPGSDQKYTALIRFNKTGYNGVPAGLDKKKLTIWTWNYLDDAKRAVERYYGLKRPVKKSKDMHPFGL